MKILTAFFLLVCTVPAFAEKGPKPALQAKVVQEINRKHAWSVIENLLRVNELTVAEAVSRQHLAKDPTDSRTWSLLAKAQVTFGRLAEAETALNQAMNTAQGDEKDSPRYAMADVRLRRGDADGAKVILESLGNTPGKTGERAREVLASLSSKSRQLPPLNPEWEDGTRVSLVDSKPPSATDRNPASLNNEAAVTSASFNGAVGVTAGFDNNILSVPLTLSPQASGLGSAYTAINTQGMGTIPVGRGPMIVSMMAAYTANSNPNAIALNNLVAGAGLRWGPLPKAGQTFGWTVSNDVLGIWMNTSGYSLYMVSNTVRWTGALRLSDAWTMELALPVALQRFMGTVTSADDDRNGYTYGADLTVRHLTSFKTALFTTLGYAGQSSNGINFRTGGFGLTLGASQPFSFLASELSASISYRRTFYTQAATGRVDGLFVASLGWSAPVFEGAKANLTVGSQSLSGTVIDTSFAKATAALGVTYAF